MSYSVTRNHSLSPTSHAFAQLNMVFVVLIDEKIFLSIFFQIKSCNGDRRQSLTKKFPNLSSVIANESAAISAVNCERHYQDQTNVKQVRYLC